MMMLLVFLGCQKQDISEFTRLGLENKENKSENPAKTLDKVTVVLSLLILKCILSL